MFKTVQIYKKDKWNMMNVEIQGKSIILREISDQWGEDAHQFLSRHEMMKWVEQRFTKEHFSGTEEERQEIIEAFKQI